LLGQVNPECMYVDDRRDNAALSAAFAGLSTALIADGCLRAGVEVRALPSSLRPLAARLHGAGRALPVRHAGSVDIFLEALGAAQPGDIMAIDDGGRTHEACIGDLIVLELQAAGLAGVVIWGSHRDSAELRAIGLPVLSLGSCPVGPRSVRQRAADALQDAQMGDVVVSREDILFADDDGVVAVNITDVDTVLGAARAIADTERAQAAAMRAGTTLRTQLDFPMYLSRRADDPAYTFRVHLRRIGGAVEE
jgi:4-hydroxy-4-methyl-2-oxoglutarate aldolase